VKYYGRYTLHTTPSDRYGRLQKAVYLFAWIDDFSRLAFGEFYWAEKLPALENTLKKWVLKRGVPENVYCDNGSVYSSHHLKNICGYLGVNLLHSRPYKLRAKVNVRNSSKL
jgi:transposase InsO family protein